MRKAGLSILLFLLIFSVQAESLEEICVYKFSDHWVEYSSDFETYIPKKEEYLNAAKSIRQLISIEQYRGYQLKVIAKKGLSIFSNNRLIYRNSNKKADTIFLEVKDLARPEDESALICFFNEQGVFPVEASIVHFKIVELEKERLQKELLEMRYRDKAHFPGLYLPMFLLLAVGATILKKYFPKETNSFIQLVSSEKNEFVLPRFVTLPNLIMSIISALSMVLIIYLVELDKLLFRPSWKLYQSALFTLFWYFVFLASKYVYTSIFAWLFNYTKHVSRQMMEFTKPIERITVLVMIGLIALKISGIMPISLNLTILYFLWLAIGCLAVTKVILSFFSIITHRNLFLFSYLCVTEILHLVMAIKFLLF